ncbi:hypothetical protein CEE35_06470 [Candidatus Aerophobetes bacterium Ae_b3b]|nr:MAG: hypothetical protein CEE35_06470 [Candidatus Aerophobetes bacterium Ae_b3b]
MKQLSSFTLEVAEIVFCISSDFPFDGSNFGKVYDDFLSEKKANVCIHVQRNAVPSLNIKKGKLVLDSGKTWSVYESQQKYIFTFKSPALGQIPYSVAVFTPTFHRGKVYIRPVTSQDKLLPNPMLYPLFELLMINLLWRRYGLMFHGCGINSSGCGYLFLGNSAHGKSTTARLWAEDRGTVLNDDRIVVREKGRKFWMYGTPWHGDFTKVSSQRIPIHKIFFLRHGKENSAVPREGIKAVSLLLTRCFPPIWDKKGMSFTVDFCRRLVEKVPCYELDFVPDEKVVDFVKGVRS